MPREPGTRPCPYCGEPIKARAVRCRYCGEDLDDDDYEDEDYRPRRRSEDEAAVRWLVPVGRSGWAIAAGYLGLLSCFPFLGAVTGILAVVTGILALRECNRNRRLGGRGRAIFGIILGSICGLANLFLCGVLLVSAVRK